MELEEAIEDVKKYISFANKEENFSSTFEFNWHKDLANRIDIVLKELDNRISKDDLKKILRKVQDYQLNYKDTVLFNIIMREIFGETEWINLENKEE